MDKTKITHAQTERARFLGYELRVRSDSDRIDDRERRSVTGRIELRVPWDVVETNVTKRMAAGKIVHRRELTQLSDYTIVRTFQSEYAGLVNYYLMARNVCEPGYYYWVMQTSLLKTLANKHKSMVQQMADKHKAKVTVDTPQGPVTMMVIRATQPREGKESLVAEFGGIPLRKKNVTELRDTPYSVWATRSDPVVRLLRQKCEMCGRTADELEEYGHQLGRIAAHHIRKLANLPPKGRRELPDWKKRMIAMRRKTLIVCTECHINIHAGRPCRPRVDEDDTVTGEPDALKGARPVRRGDDGKGA